MDYIDVIRNRRSCKDFSNKKVDSSIIDRVVQAGNLAPIGMGNPQNFHITVVSNPNVLDMIDLKAAELFNSPNCHPLYGATTLIIISVFEINDRNRMTYGCTAGCIAENMLLSAVNEGIAAVCMTGIIRAVNKNEDVLSKLNLPNGYTPVFSVALGIPMENAFEPRIIENNIILRNDI